MNTFKKCTVLLALMSFGHNFYSQKSIDWRRIYLGFEIGAGNLNHIYNGISEGPDIRFSFGFYLGYAPFSWLKLGLTGSGWTIEPGDYNDPSKGIGIGNIYAQCRIFPLKKVLCFVNLEGGRTEYSNNHELALYATGPGAKFGVGFEHRFSKHVAIYLLVNFGIGRFNDVNYPPLKISVINNHYNVLELLFGFTFNHLPIASNVNILDP